MSPPTLRLTAHLAALGGVFWLAIVPLAIVNAGRYDDGLVLTTTGGYVLYGLFTLCLALFSPSTPITAARTAGSGAWAPSWR